MAPKKEVPRWRRKPPPPGIQLSRPAERRIVREVTKAVTATGVAPAAIPGAVPEGKVIPAPGARTLAAAGAYRFRLHLVPAVWLLAVTGLGLAMHETHAFRPAVITGIAAGAAIVLLSRHLSPFARKTALALGCLTSLWLPFLASLGWSRPWPPVLFASWLCVAIPWAARYRWRPGQNPKNQPDMTDAAIWMRLAAKNKWSGHLVPASEPAAGVRQYGIVLDGAETHMGQIMSEPRRIAAAWGKSIAEAYAEPSPDGVESRGLLTILPRNTLEAAREWDGTGIDPETGMAVIGRFPDGKPSHERYFIRRNGVRHTIVCGADGSGKTGMLNLGLSLSATSGVIAPVILDPQEGQALPAWKDHVPYASGVDECDVYSEALEYALFDRSRYLGSCRWRTPDGDERRGFDFFDPFLTGLPIVEVTLDEASAMFLAGKTGAEILARFASMGKLGRKAGKRLRIAIHVPSLAEFGGNAQALRSILAGGNVLCGRTGDKVTSGMIGVQADPSQLPKYFADGSPTVGLGYGSGPDNRPATPQRWDWVPDPYKVAHEASIRPLDDRFAEAMDRVIEKRRVASVAAPASAAPLAAVPPPDDDGPEGRTCADAILAVLDREMTRGQIITAVKALTEGQWGRPRTFSTKAVQNALTAMSGDARIAKPREGTYAPSLPSPPSLHAVGAAVTAASPVTPATR
jgi:hypothetical protein